MGFVKSVAESAAYIAMARVLQEREDQDATWGEQNHNMFTWLAILQEEIGEFSEAILHDQFGGGAAGTAQKELTHVAAVAMAVLECHIRRYGEEV